MSIESIRYIEELAANAWPAAVVQVVDGWRLRFNWGITRRANSVWPNHLCSDQSLDEKLSVVEEFYARRDVPARYQISPAMQPAHLDTILVARGYLTDARTCVQTTLLKTVMAQTHPNPVYTVRVTDTFDENWFSAYCQAEQVSNDAAEIRQGILQRIAPHTGYALLYFEHRPIALGLGVVERGWLGVFNMATHPDFRRRGAATAVLHTLANWGQQHQATQIYLQVMADNAPARALYAQSGFETRYHYHYREQN